LCLVAVVAAAGIARGQTPTTWIGATNSTWSGASNWSGGAVPTSSSDATFDQARNTFLNVSGTVNKLIFTGTATIAGSLSSNNALFTLQINNGLTHTANNSGSSFMRIQTIVLGGSQTWDLNGTSGTNSVSAVGFTLTPQSNPAAMNTFTLGGNTWTKTGSGQVSFGNVSIGNGNISIDAGSVRFGTGALSSSGTSMQVIGTGTILAKSGAALILNNGGGSSGAFDITKPIRLEGTSGTPSILQYAGGSDNLPGVIASPIEWAGVTNFTNFWTGSTATTNSTDWRFTGNWTGSGTVNLVTTATNTVSSSILRKTTISGSNAGFTGVVNNQQSAAADVRFASSNAGSANAEWQLNDPSASYKLAGFSVAFGALSGTAGSLGNYGTTTSSTATIGGKGTDTTFSGLLVDGSTASLAVVKTGAGTLTLGNTNSYTGLTDVQAGRLAYGVSNALGSGAVTVSGGTLDMGSFSDTVGTVTLTGGTIAGTTGVLAASSYDLRSGVVSAILGGSGINLTKSTSGTVALSGVSTYTGATAINAGMLKVDGSIAASSGLSVAAAAWLAGSGTAPAVSGAGLISPGSSPGILTTASIDPSAGMGFGFELTGTGSPNYGSPTSSVNDVLRLTGGTPSLAALTGSNAVSVYFGTTIADGDVFRGGTYVDSATTSGSRTAFETAISGGDWQFFVLGNGGGTHAFNGQNYYTLGEYDPSLTISRSVVADPADFGSGVINGSVTQFVVVPEPNAVALVAMAAVGFAVAGRRLRLRDRQVG
jgi:autotransporter-associated beta strand protein